VVLPDASRWEGSAVGLQCNMHCLEDGVDSVLIAFHIGEHALSGHDCEACLKACSTGSFLPCDSCAIIGEASTSR